MVKTAPRIIGLHSRIPGSGKSTAARGLCEQLGFCRIPFAESLKRMTQVFLEEQGLDSSEIEFLMDDGKQLEQEALFGVTPRWVMQSLGTDWGRTCIHPQIWLRSFTVKANKALVNHQSIVVDDVRFNNEAELIRSVGGAVFMVSRPDAICQSEVLQHASEGGIDSSLISGTITNNNVVMDENMPELVDPIASARLFGHHAVQMIVESEYGHWNGNYFQLPPWGTKLPEPGKINGQD